MTKRKPKRKPKRIPNAEEVAKVLPQTASTRSDYTLSVKIDPPETTSEYVARKEREALERGRTIGRIEGLADAFECPWDAKSIVGVSAQSRALLAPILRAEIERLRSKP